LTGCFLCAFFLLLATQIFDNNDNDGDISFMKTTRKQFATLALAAMATGFIGHAAAQGAYPSKNVTMVVPTAAGGTTMVTFLDG